MTPQELENKFNAEDWNTVSALIEYQDERGIAIRIGENLAHNWQSGEIIVFWEDGEHTVLPDDFELVKYNVWR